MNFSSNIKDTLTTIAAWITGICTTIIGLPILIAQASPTVVFTLPPIVNTICGVLIGVALVITQLLNGKNPDGTTKTPSQVIQINKKAEETKPAEK